MKLPITAIALLGLGSAMLFSGAASACDECEKHGRQGHHASGERHGGLWGMMPQSCYNPPYGCYSGLQRNTHRYPAFHGTYYRRPYNYRNTFDYPWHAGLHEPTSHFSYNTEEQETFDRPVHPAIKVPLPLPEVEMEQTSSRRSDTGKKFATNVSKTSVTAEKSVLKKSTAERQPTERSSAATKSLSKWSPVKPKAAPSVASKPEAKSVSHQEPTPAEYVEESITASISDEEAGDDATGTIRSLRR